MNKDYIELFKEKLEADNKSPETIRAYMNDIKEMLLYVSKNENEISYADLIKWKYNLTNTLKRAGSTVNRKITTVTEYFNFLMKIKIANENPALGLGYVQNIPVEKKEYIPMSTAKELLRYGKNPRDKAIIAVYLTTGLRVQELINLTLEDYNGTSANIVTKRHKMRSIVFNSDCRKYVDEYLKVRKRTIYNNLFISNQGTPMQPNSISKTLKVIAKRAGISETISNHSLRHTFCSNVCDNYGVAMAKEVIGHSSINTTQRYCHNTEQQIQNVITSVSL